MQYQMFACGRNASISRCDNMAILHYRFTHNINVIWHNDCFSSSSDSRQRLNSLNPFFTVLSQSEMTAFRNPFFHYEMVKKWSTCCMHLDANIWNAPVCSTAPRSGFAFFVRTSLCKFLYFVAHRQVECLSRSPRECALPFLLRYIRYIYYQ